MPEYGVYLFHAVKKTLQIRVLTRKAIEYMIVTNFFGMCYEGLREKSCKFQGKIRKLAGPARGGNPCQSSEKRS